jgi:radical SAM protein with 4Fe4S-binding SPASM domain
MSKVHLPISKTNGNAGARALMPVDVGASAASANRDGSRTSPGPTILSGLYQLKWNFPARPALHAYLRGAQTVFIVKHPDIVIPDDVANSILHEDGDAPYVRYDVSVNRSLKSAVRLERFRTRHVGARIFVLVYWLVMIWFSRWETDHSRVLWRRGCRLLARRLRTGADAIRKYFYGDASANSVPLNKYILTNALHELPEFSFPAGIHLALTKNCNLKCIMCPYHSDDLRAQHTLPYFEHGERMPESLLARIIEEAGRHRANIAFGQYDEPFIYKGFAGWAARAKRAGCSVAVTTNGTLLDEEDAKILLEAGIDHISFSLDAATAETYRKIRLDDFALPLENLRRLVAIRNAGKFSTQIRACMVLQQHNRHEADAFSILMEEIGVDIVSFYNLTVLDGGVWRIPALNFDVTNDAPGERNVCSQLYNQLAVYPDGQVALCCLTTMYVGYRSDVPYVGNANTNSLRDIWLSEPYLRVRREAFENTFSNSVCRDCTIWHNFQGREFTDEKGRRVYKNAYETFVYLR